MASAVRLDGPSLVPSYLSENPLLRCIFAELAEIREELEKSPLQDEMTQDIRQWEREFFFSLRRTGDAQTKLNEFTRLLQELLRDPIVQAPLEEGALLGSDGRTYGRMSLCVYLKNAPEQYRHRSPKDLRNEAPFTTTPHPNVDLMLRWLGRRNSLLHSEELELSYRSLVERNIVPIIPTEQTERIRRIRERQDQLERERVEQRAEFAQRLSHLRRGMTLQDAQSQVVPHQSLNQQISNLSQAIRDEVQQNFAPLHERVQASVQRQMERLNEMERRDESQLQILSQVVEQLRLDSENLEVQNRELEEQINRVGIAISEAEKDDIQLRIAINKTRNAIKKRKSGWLTSLGTTIAIVGACSLATWAVSGVILSSGITANGAIVPAQQGATATLVIPF